MSDSLYPNSIHNVKVSEEGVYVDGRKIEHVDEVNIHKDLTSFPQVTLVMRGLADFEELSDIRLIFESGSIEEAFRCIGLNMRLDIELREAIAEEVREALVESGQVKEPYGLADEIIERIFLKER